MTNLQYWHAYINKHYFHDKLSPAFITVQTHNENRRNIYVHEYPDMAPYCIKFTVHKDVSELALLAVLYDAMKTQFMHETDLSETLSLFEGEQGKADTCCPVIPSDIKDGIAWHQKMIAGLEEYLSREDNRDGKS